MATSFSRWTKLQYSLAWQIFMRRFLRGLKASWWGPKWLLLLLLDGLDTRECASVCVWVCGVSVLDLGVSVIPLLLSTPNPKNPVPVYPQQAACADVVLLLLRIFLSRSRAFHLSISIRRLIECLSQADQLDRELRYRN